MRNFIHALFVVVLISLFAFAEGVANNSTWSNATGTHSVTVTLEAQTSGNYKVTFTEGADSGSTDWGTPDPEGGCQDCPAVGVGGESYRIKDKGSKSVVQWKNPGGHWITLGENATNTSGGQGHVNIWINDEYGGTSPPLATDNETVGTLP